MPTHSDDKLAVRNENLKCKTQYYKSDCGTLQMAHTFVRMCVCICLGEIENAA